MPAIFHIHGYVAPKGVTISFVPPDNMTFHPGGLAATVSSMSVKIQDSIIDVEFSLNSAELTGAQTISLVRASADIVRAITDLFSLSLAVGLTPILESFVGPDGDQRNIVPAEKWLEPHCTAFNLADGIDQVLPIILKEPLARLALNDLVMAVTMPNFAQVNCARAAESIRNMIATDLSSEADRTKAWEQMREILRVDKAYLKLITGSSVAARHGQRDKVDNDIVPKIMQRAWVIMSRFLEYRKGGNKPLPPESFPLLEG